MINIIELRVEMIRKNLNDNTLAKAIGLSKQSLSYKLNNKRQLTLANIESIVDVLKLSPARRDEIFFADDASSKEAVG